MLDEIYTIINTFCIDIKRLIDQLNNMTDTAKKKKLPYILGGNPKMVGMRLPESTRLQLDILSKERGKSKTLIVVEAIDDMANQ